MDLVRLSHYPFLPTVKDAVAELGPGIDQVLSNPIYEDVRRRGVARIMGALRDRKIPPALVTDERGALAELLSVPIARMLAVLLGDRTLIHRYAAAEGLRLEATLLDDVEAIPDVAEELRVKADSEGNAWRMHFADYLSVAPTHEADWKLINRPVQAGWVPLSAQSMARLCREALQQRIQDELEAETKRPVHASIQEALAGYVEDLKPQLAEARENWNTGDFGPVQKTLFPPCIKQLFQDMLDGKMIPHHGRFAIASFLATIGMTVEDIMDYYREIPNFSEEKSRYQIEHIAGDRGVEKYTPPGCATMQTNGICPLEKRDNLCFKIKHPLSYYRAQLNFQKRDEQKAARAAGDPNQGDRPETEAAEVAKGG